jgi:hypothetical protein
MTVHFIPPLSIGPRLAGFCVAAGQGCDVVGIGFAADGFGCPTRAKPVIMALSGGVARSDGGRRRPMKSTLNPA